MTEIKNKNDVQQLQDLITEKESEGFKLSPDCCLDCGTQYYQASWPDRVWCPHCDKEENTTSALSYL